MVVRVPSWREHLDNIAVSIRRQKQLAVAGDKERWHKSWVDFAKGNEKARGMDGEEMRQFILRDEFEMVQASVSFNLGAMFTTFRSVLAQLKTFGYQVLYAPEGRFFWTSDSPVYTLLPDKTGATIGTGFGWDRVVVYFPLNKKACLRLRRGIKPMGRMVEADRVDKINNLSMATASTYLYSSEGYRRIARLFDERGCKVRPGKESFLLTPPEQHRVLFTR